MNLYQIKHNLRLLLEQASQTEEFFNKIDRSYGLTPELKQVLIEFIYNSDCRKIQFAKFKYPAHGLAMHDGVMINQLLLDPTLKSNSLEFLIYAIMHEVAHQYQYKKYGSEKIYSMYTGEMDKVEAAKLMLEIERIADKFACMKIRQIQKINLLDKDFKCPSMYDNASLGYAVSTIEKWSDGIKKLDIKSPEKIAEWFYNLIIMDFNKQ